MAANPWVAPFEGDIGSFVNAKAGELCAYGSPTSPLSVPPKLQAHAYRPNFLQLQRRLLAGQSPFVPRYPRRARVG
jgi:hypothetical protein